MQKKNSYLKIFLAGLFSVFLCSCDMIGKSKTSAVKFTTNLGDFVVELNAEKAPKTVENFLAYVNDGYYNGTIFHRVIENFMVQGGGHTESLRAKSVSRDPVANESDNGLSNLAGTIAMARTNDPDSATTQFFINTKDNVFLDHQETKPGYTVFGKVIEGYNVVQAIEKQPTGNKQGYQNVPLKPIVIQRVERL